MKNTGNNILKKVLLTVAAVALMTFQGFSQTKVSADATQAIFPKGKQGPASNFTGKAFTYGLLDSDSTFNTVVGNVLFEPGARSNRVGGPMA